MVAAAFAFRCDPLAARLPVKVVVSKHGYEPALQAGGTVGFLLEGPYGEGFNRQLAAAKRDGLRLVAETCDNVLLDPDSDEAIAAAGGDPTIDTGPWVLIPKI